MECVTVKMLTTELGFEHMLPVLGALHNRFEAQPFRDCDVEKYRKLYMALQEQEAINSKYSIYVMTNLSDYPPFNKLGLVDMNFAIYDKKESNFYGSIANYPSLSELLGMEIIQGGEYVSTLEELQANLFWELAVVRKTKNA